ncbi:ribosome biogenesis protein ytm1 [Coemansia sp. RSA 2523]|nr:ribosome biogenesis protein ytm1 [Coemansia sp. RSA 2523]KAJ2576690.1 ribosome biogenesis protein ytm1 [Coemansia sp. RSA 1807]
MNRSQRRSRREGADSDQSFEKQNVTSQLSTLERLVEEARASTYEAINSHHRDFLSIRVYTHDPLDEAATLNDKYETTSTLVATNPSPDLIERLDNIGHSLKAIVRMAKTHANLKDIDDQILHGEIAVCASSIVEAGEMLNEIEDMRVSQEPLQVLHGQFVKKRAAVRAELEYLSDEMVRVVETGCVHELHVTYGVTSNYDNVPYENAVTLSDLFFAMRELDVVRTRADVLVTALAENWLLPLLRAPSTPLSVSRTKLGASMSIGAFGRSSAVFVPSAMDHDQFVQHIVDVQRVWTTVLQFVRDDLFHECDDDHADVYAYMGQKLWARVWPTIHDELLVPLVPDNVDALSDVQCMVPLLELENAWMEVVPIAELRVRNAARSLLQTYVSKRRSDLLTTVASILASDDANVVVVGGDGPVIDVLAEHTGKGGKGGKNGKGGKGGKGSMLPEEDADGALHFPRCSISVQAQLLVEFARETIGFAQGDGSRTAATYVHAVRDAFSLYRCLMPSQWSILSVDAKRAFIMFNDCTFLVHHLTALGHGLREHWPRELRASATFVDLIASFRTLARESMSPVLQRTRDSVVRELGMWTQKGWLNENVLDDAEQRLVVACGCVAQVAHTAQAHLPSRVYLTVLGLLADVVVGYVAKRLSECVVSDTKARALVRLVAPVLALESRLFVLTSGTGQTRAPVAKYCSEWDGLQTQVRRLSMGTK